jgi:hypothetical protein
MRATAHEDVSGAVHFRAVDEATRNGDSRAGVLNEPADRPLHL